MKKLIALALLAGSTMFAGPRFAIGVGIGVGGGYYPPAPVVAYARPIAPGPGYNWVDGYWYYNGPRRLWRAGYWAPPAFVGTYRVAPRYYGPRYVGPRHYEHGFRR